MRENTSRTLTCGFTHCQSKKKRQFFFLYLKNSAFLTWHYRCSTVSGLDDHVNPRGGGWLSAPTSVSREANKIPVLLFFLLPLGVTASLCSHRVLQNWKVNTLVCLGGFIGRDPTLWHLPVGSSEPVPQSWTEKCCFLRQCVKTLFSNAPWTALLFVRCYCETTKKGVISLFDGLKTLSS